MYVKLGLFIPLKIKAYKHIIQSNEERLKRIQGHNKKIVKNKFK